MPGDNKNNKSRDISNLTRADSLHKKGQSNNEARKNVLEKNLL